MTTESRVAIVDDALLAGAPEVRRDETLPARHGTLAAGTTRGTRKALPVCRRRQVSWRLCTLCLAMACCTARQPRQYADARIIAPIKTGGVEP
jgi:hypothetical protein